eukprot:3357078-Rhodomonas_salina.1
MGEMLRRAMWSHGAESSERRGVRSLERPVAAPQTTPPELQATPEEVPARLALVASPSSTGQTGGRSLTSWDSPSPTPPRHSH